MISARVHVFLDAAVDKQEDCCPADWLACSMYRVRMRYTLSQGMARGLKARNMPS